MSDELARLDCHEIALARVVEGTAEFVRKDQRLRCRVGKAVRLLFRLPHHAGDDAVWSALEHEQTDRAS